MRRRGRLGFVRRHRRLAVAAATPLLALLGLIVYAFCAPFDPPDSKMDVPGTVVLDANGVVLQRDGADGIRIPVTLNAVAPLLIEATIAAEDSRFSWHPGVDPLAMTRATVQLRSQRSGASTITQQLVRRLYLPRDSSPLLLRKTRESLIAFQLEAHLSKDEILEHYLNAIYYGRGAYGIEAAARVYFGSRASNLDLAQAAMLAGLPQVPSAFDAASEPGPARERQRYVLDRMARDGKISRDDADAAWSEPLQFLDAVEPPVAPHFVRYALAELSRLRPDLADRPGLVIETTLDAGLQQEAEHAARRRLTELADKDAHNAAVVILEPGSGRVLTMVGNVDFFDADHGGQLNMAIEPRQPGSALKPFLYAAAFEHGYTPASLLLDIPTVFDTPSGPYAPQNYDRRFRGPVPLRVALASSLNVPAVRVLDEIGVDAFLQTTHRFGLRTLTDAEVYGLALTLGGGEVRLLDLAGAYGVLANRGELAEPYSVVRVRDQTGTVLYEHLREPSRPVISAQHAYLIADILSDADARISGFGRATPFDLPFRAAVKTGTTSGWHDNWTVGFTGDRVVGVWVGNTDNQPMKDVSGVDGAGPIWRDVMLAAAGGAPAWFQRPPDIVQVTVCQPSGLLPGLHCPSAADELFVSGTEPRSRESYYDAEADGRLLVDPPTVARTWSVDAALPLVATAPAEGSVFVVQPGNGTVVFLAPELRDQQLLIRAAVPGDSRSVEIWLDGQLLGNGSPADPRILWPLAIGRHVLKVAVLQGDGRSSTASSTFEVRAP